MVYLIMVNQNWREFGMDYSSSVRISIYVRGAPEPEYQVPVGSGTCPNFQKVQVRTRVWDITII